MKLREQNDASTSALRAYAQHERPLSARPERSEAKSKDERATNFTPLRLVGGGIAPLFAGDGQCYEGTEKNEARKLDPDQQEIVRPQWRVL